MYQGYKIFTTNEPGDHPTEQWREQRSRSERDGAMPLYSICGWQARRFLGDVEDKKII
jgi:hypothetical protein